MYEILDDFLEEERPLDVAPNASAKVTLLSSAAFFPRPPLPPRPPLLPRPPLAVEVSAAFVVPLPRPLPRPRPRLVDGAALLSESSLLRTSLERE